MDAKDAYIEHLENTIKDLTNQVNNLTEMLLLMRKEKFGPSELSLSSALVRLWPTTIDSCQATASRSKSVIARS